MTASTPTGIFTASIEAKPGYSFQHGFHLGTDEAIARKICEEMFAARAKHDQAIITIGLKRDGKLVDVFSGSMWDNDWDCAQAWAHYDLKEGRIGPWGCHWNMPWHWDYLELTVKDA